MPSGVERLIRDISSGNKKRIEVAINSIRTSQGISPEELSRLLKALVSVLKSDDVRLSSKALDAMLRLSNENPSVARALAPALTTYGRILIARATDEPEITLKLLAKIVAIAGSGIKMDPGVKGPYAPLLTAIISPPVYNPQKDDSWIKLYSASIRLLSIPPISPDTESGAIQNIIKILGDTYKYSNLRENARKPDGLRWQASAYIRTLEYESPETLIPYIIKNIGDENREFRQVLNNIVLDIARRSDKVIPILINALYTPMKPIKENVAKLIVLIAKTHPDQFIPHIHSFFERDEMELNVIGLKVLGIVGSINKSAVGNFRDILIKQSSSQYKEVRRNAIEALGMIISTNPDEFSDLIPFLVNALNDPDEGCVLTAIAAMKKISEKKPESLEFALPAIIPLTRDPRDHVVWRVKDLLSNLNVDPVEYPRTWRMIDRARKLLLEAKKRNEDISRYENMLKECEVFLINRRYEDAYTRAKEIVDAIPVPPSEDKKERETENKFPITKTTENLPPPKTTSTGLPLFSHYDEDEEIPIEGKARELIEKVSSQDKDIPAPEDPSIARIHELMNKFRKEMSEISIDLDTDEDDYPSSKVEDEDDKEVAMEPITPIPTPQRLFCHYCGARIPPDSVFCPNCGRKLI